MIVIAINRVLNLFGNSRENCIIMAFHSINNVIGF